MNRFVLSAIVACSILVAYALTAPDVQAGSGAYGCGSAPTLADDFGCSEPVAASCGGDDRSILLVARGDGRLRRLLRGMGGALTPFDGNRTFRPQPRFQGRFRGRGCG